MTEAEMKEEKRGTWGEPKLFVYARTSMRVFEDWLAETHM